MSKEKLTVDRVGKSITYDIAEYKNGKEILIKLKLLRKV